jgi:hypothetical protein
MSILAHATYAAQGLEAERRNLDATVRHEAAQRAALRKPGPTPGYRCVHGAGYKCRTCYAQPGEVPYL